MESSFIVLIDDNLDRRYLLSRFLERKFTDRVVFEFQETASAELLIFSPYRKVVVMVDRLAGKIQMVFAARVITEALAPVIMISVDGEVSEKAVRIGVLAVLESRETERLCTAVALAFEAVGSPAQ